MTLANERETRPPERIAFKVVFMLLVNPTQSIVTLMSPPMAFCNASTSESTSCKNVQSTQLGSLLKKRCKNVTYDLQRQGKFRNGDIWEGIPWLFSKHLLTLSDLTLHSWSLRDIISSQQVQSVSSWRCKMWLNYVHEWGFSDCDTW